MLWKSFKYIIMNKNYFVSECSVAMTLLRRLDPERNLKTRMCVQCLYFWRGALRKRFEVTRTSIAKGLKKLHTSN